MMFSTNFICSTGREYINYSDVGGVRDAEVSEIKWLHFVACCIVCWDFGGHIGVVSGVGVGRLCRFTAMLRRSH